MATTTKLWGSGSGSVTITYGGSGNGNVSVVSDANTIYEQRSMDITIQTTAGSPQQTKTITISQAAKLRIDISNAVVTAANQTYSGSALTPAPTVTLNGTTIPSTGYDVTYSNNTNAGTATVTVTGKGDYTGTASGTFTIAKANPTYTAPTAATGLVYNGSGQRVFVAGTVSGGIIQTSPNGTKWYASQALTAKNAGDYTYYWRIVGDANHNDVEATPVQITIAKATPVIDVAPSLATNLTYTASAYSLLSGGSMKRSNADSAAVSGTFTYQQETNAGTYTDPTWSFTPTDTTNYNSTSGTVTGSVTIAQAIGLVTTAPTARSITYTGSGQYIVTAGSGTGTIYYRYRYKDYSSSSFGSWSSFSTTRPSRTNAGYYEVEYYAAASSDGNFTQSATGTVSGIVMAKATRTISFTTKPTSVDVYGTVTVTATPSKSDGTVTYISSDTSIATVSGNVVTGVAEGSAIITASVPETNNCYSATTSYTIGVVFNYEKEYLTIESLVDNNSIKWALGSQSLSAKPIYWSIDRENWTSVTPTLSGTEILPLSKGQKLYLKGNNTTYSNANYSYGHHFTSTARYLVSGNILSLIHGDSFAGKTGSGASSYTFIGLFKSNQLLISAQDLILPSTLKTQCFAYMFFNCTGLLVAPKLPASSLQSSCYKYMFYSCTSLSKAPKLPATNLLANCYQGMFQGCSNLNYVWCLATSISATNCTSNWLKDVAGTGTFIRATTSWSTGESGVPIGWNIVSGRSEYTKVQYLQSSGTQYIDLDFFGTDRIGAEIKFKYHDLSSSSASARVFGTREGSGSKAFAYITSYSGTIDTTKAFYLACRNSATASTFAVKIDSEDHVVKINVNNDGKAYIDSTLALTAGDAGSFTSTGIASLFRTYSALNGGYLGACVARIYYLKIYYNGKLIMDLVPVRASDSTATGWMYDQISDVFYENSGTGNFVVGPDV